MATLLSEPNQPILLHSQSLGHISTTGHHLRPRLLIGTYQGELQPVRPLSNESHGEVGVIDYLGCYIDPVPEKENRSRSWKLKRKMSSPNFSPSISSPPMPSHPTRTRYQSRPRRSLSALLGSSRLTRLLSTSSLTPSANPVPTLYSPNSDGTASINAVSLNGKSGHHARPTVSRSATLPSFLTLPSGESVMELSDEPEELFDEPFIVEMEEVVESESISRANVNERVTFDCLSPSTRYHSSKLVKANTPLIPLDTSPAVSRYASAPTSPCQGVWLCTPPKPLTSPILETPLPQRRPAITTRAISTARVANVFDEKGAIIHFSLHSERVLTKGAVVQGASCWREKYACCPKSNYGTEVSELGVGLTRSKSAALPLGSGGIKGARPGIHRADTTGHVAHAAQLSGSASTSALTEKTGWPREWESREPLLEELKDDEDTITDVREWEK